VKQKENEPPYPYGEKMEGDAVWKGHKEEREMLIRSIGDEHLSLPFCYVCLCSHIFRKEKVYLTFPTMGAVYFTPKL
jgi:hypothetical protein